jgi:hypothetical protein
MRHISFNAFFIEATVYDFSFVSYVAFGSAIGVRARLVTVSVLTMHTGNHRSTLHLQSLHIPLAGAL